MNIYSILNKIKTKVPESERYQEDQEMTDQMKVMAKKVAGKQKRRQVLYQRAAAAAIIVIVCGGTAVAASNGWENVMLKLFNQSLTGKDTKTDLEKYSPSNQVIAEDESQNVKVKAVQTAATKGMIYILLKAELPENQKFREDQTFQYHLLKTGAQDDSKKKEMTGMAADRLQLVQRKENVGWFIYQAERADYNFKNQKIGLSLEGFTSTHTTAKDLIFEDPRGSWDLTWKADNSRMDTEAITVDKEYNFPEGKEIIKKIEITPFYLRIYHGRKGSPDDNYNLPECSVRIKDGTVRKLQWSYSQGADRSESGYAYHHSDFTKLMDPGQAEAVMIGGNEIIISQKKKY